MKYITITLILLFLQSCTVLERSYNSSMEISAAERDYGYILNHRENVLIIESKENPGQFREVSYSEPYTYKTNVVPLVKGVDFGFRFEVIGLSAADSKRLWFVIKHPEMRRPDGRISSEYSGARYLEHDDNWGYYYDWSYKLSEDYEIVPGLWIIDVYYQDELLIKKSFNIVRQSSNNSK